MFNFKKRYGQNFLIDKNIVSKIVNSVNILESNLVIEIGCGDGRLTTFLTSKFDNVLAYEIDLELKDILLKKFETNQNVDFIFDDFLTRNIKEDIKKYNALNIYVVANLPYYITTPIIEKIINSGICIKEMCIMVQKEVGDRFAATIRTKNYSSLSVYLDYYFDVRKLFVVSRNSFMPKPNVDSIVILFKNKEKKLDVKNLDLFFKLIKDSFRFKRKTIKNNLKEYDLKKVEEVLKANGLSLNSRAEEVSTQVFCDIVNFLSI